MSETQCVILFRNPSNGRIGFIGDDDKIEVFKNYPDAVALSEEHKLLQVFPFQIVELDEL